MADKHEHGPEDATWSPKGGIPPAGAGNVELVEWYRKHAEALSPTLEVAESGPDSVAEQRKAAAADRRSSDAPAGRSSKPHTTT